MAAELGIRAPLLYRWARPKRQADQSKAELSAGQSVEQLEAEIRRLCEALLVSRSGYYDWKNRRSKPGPREVENTHLRERIREEFARSRQTYGSPRIAHALGCPGRRNRIARLMRKERLYARQRSKYRAAITDSRHVRTHCS